MLVMYKVCRKEYCGQFSDEYVRNVRLLSALSKVTQRVRIPKALSLGLGWGGSLPGECSPPGGMGLGQKAT